MIVFVDYEHVEGHAAEWGPRIQAARTWITYRLEDLAGQHCMLVRYDRITMDLLDRLGATALFISGNGSDPSTYRSEELAPLEQVVGQAGLPVFGFCGGFQFLSQMLGASLVPIEVTPAQAETDIIRERPGGGHVEFGYHPVELVAAHPLLDGLGGAPVFRHSHRLHVPDAPPGFEVLASTDVTPVQMAVDDERRMVGTQFHPEYWTDEHPAGRTMIANFLDWIR